MNLPELSIKYPITTTMGVLIVMVLGIVSFTRIGVDFFPSIDYPTIAVLTRYPGAVSEEIETLITRPLEGAIASVNGVKQLKSTSQEGYSLIQAEFRWGMNLDFAAQDVRNIMEMVISGLPDEVERPIVFKNDTDLMPVLFFCAISKTDRDLRNLRKLIEDTIEKSLENLPGVASVMVMGGLDREILVEVDKDRLKAHNLSLSDIKQVLKEQNKDIPGGHLTKGNREYILRTFGKYRGIEQISKTIVKTENGYQVYIKDVATVKDLYKEVRSHGRLNQKEAVIFYVTKETGTNTVEVSDRVLKELEEMKKLLPPDVVIKDVFDSSKLVRDSYHSLGVAVQYGAVITIIVIFLFLFNIRATLALAFSIPFAIIATFIAIYSVDYTLNLVTLCGLALGVGMMVDNSIVVLENTFRHLEKGTDRKTAAKAGATEVSMAITASTLTTIIVFLPLVFAQGLTGQLTKPLGLTVTFSLIASLIVALTLVPVIASRTLKIKPGMKEERFYDRLKDIHQKTVAYTLEHKTVTFISTFIIFVLSIVLLKLAGAEFLPKLNETYTTAVLRMEQGTPLDETTRFVNKIEKAIMEEPEYRSVMSMIGISEASQFDLIMGSGPTGVNEAEIFYEIAPKQERKRNGIEFMEVIRSKIPRLTNGAFFFLQTTDYMTLGGERPIEIKLFGKDLYELKRLSDKIMERMKKIHGITDLENTFKMGKPEFQITVDRDKASSMGITVNEIADTIETAFLGKEVTKYREAGDEYDIRVRLSEKDRESVENLADVLVTSPKGFQVNLSNIAQINEGMGPIKIQREDQQRKAVVSADIYGRDMVSVMDDLRKSLSNFSLPDGYFIKLGGSLKDVQEFQITMFWTLSLVILLVYMVMASQFESLFHPLSIMFTVPMSLIGVSLALIISRTTINIMSFIGMMILIGVVVNNGIVMVDYINQLRASGMEKKAAIVEGSAVRLRPILMTSLTTIFGLIPMIVSKGEGSELFAPLGITLFGGMITSTFLTLLVLPVIYSIIDTLGEKTRKLFSRI
jgi:HAE1 family hydrophobic/amphiphilic exporter-1